MSTAKAKMNMTKEQLKKLHQESDRHITVTRNDKKLIDDGRLTTLGREKLGMTKKEIYKALCKRDGRKCHYCGIEEEKIIKVWGKFYKQDKRGYRLELDKKDPSKDYDLENCVLACAVCNCAKSNKLTYEEFLKVGTVIREIWQQREKKRR